MFYLSFPMPLSSLVHHCPPSSTPQEIDDAHDQEIDDAHDHEKMKMVSQFNSLPLFPPGWDFRPTDVELIVHYLRKKVLNLQLPVNFIPEVQLYNHDPEYLTEKYPPCGEKTWYFFTSRDRKSKNGIRPNRVAGNGYWKASGGDKPIKSNGYHIGDKMVLVFHKGRPSENDKKTNWIMHEYRVIQGSTHRTSREPNDMKLDDWVLCKIHKHVYKTRQIHQVEAPRDNANILMGNGPANSSTNLDLSSNNNEMDTDMELVNPITDAEFNQFLQYDLPPMLSEFSTDMVLDNFSCEPEINFSYEELTTLVDLNSFNQPMHPTDSNSQMGSSAAVQFADDDYLGLLQQDYDRYGIQD